MSAITIVTHFSEPNWPLVNKLGMISKCLEVNHRHCSSEAKLREVLSGVNNERVLFFTDEGLTGVVSELDERMGRNQIEVAMFIHTTLNSAARTISKLKSVKYLIGMQSMDAIGRDLSILIRKFSDGDILDLGKYLAFGSKVHERMVDSSVSKREVVEEVGKYVERFGDPGYLHPFSEYSHRISELTDELLLNAIFDANPNMSGVDRSKPFQLTPEAVVKVAWGYDGEYFGVSVRDPFGQITCDTILSYVASQRKMSEIAASSSAGLGLKIIFDRAHQIITNVRKEQITEVIALVKFGSRMLDYESQKKSFYYFSDTDRQKKEI